MQYCHLAPYPNHSVANAEKHCPVNGGQVWLQVLHVTVQGKVLLRTRKTLTAAAARKEMATCPPTSRAKSPRADRSTIKDGNFDTMQIAVDLSHGCLQTLSSPLVGPDAESELPPLLDPVVENDAVPAEAVHSPSLSIAWDHFLREDRCNTAILLHIPTTV